MKSESIKEITAALAKAQLAFKPIKRTERVDYATTGGRKKYNYAPLSEVIEATKQGLSDNGLAVTQTTRLILPEGIILETLLSHSSGEWLSGELYVGKQDQPPQSEGSALTYKRRYGMSAILCVASEDDDDGEGVEGRKEESPVKAKTLPPKKPETSPKPGIQPQDTPESKSSPVGEGKSRIPQEVADGSSLISLDWLKEKLESLRTKGVKGWDEPSLLSYMEKTYSILASDVIDAARQLDKNKAQHFVKKIEESVKETDILTKE